MVNNLPVRQETRVRSLGWDVPLEEGMAIHYSILAWRIPCTEKPGGLQSVGSQRVGHDWTTNTVYTETTLHLKCKGLKMNEMLTFEMNHNFCNSLWHFFFHCNIWSLKKKKEVAPAPPHSVFWATLTRPYWYHLLPSEKSFSHIHRFFFENDKVANVSKGQELVNKCLIVSVLKWLRAGSGL